MRRLILIGSVCALTLLGSLCAFAVVTWSERTVEQPIQYSHKAHVEKNIDCVECHPGAGASARATIPNIEVCGNICHRTDLPLLTDPAEDEKYAEEQKLRVYLAEGKRIRWGKVYRVDSHVYFSHVRHTVLARIDCETCHGDVAEMTTPVQKQAVPISMGRCMECHEQQGVDNDCILCHR